MKTLLYPVYEFRPIEVPQQCLRFNHGRWTKDDGEFDLAFIGRHQKGYPEALYVQLPYHKNILWKYCKNGNWGAFVSKHPQGNAWHYMLRKGSQDWGDGRKIRNHSNSIAEEKALRKCASIYGCANGRSVEFKIGDTTITEKKLREVVTKKIVSFPKMFNCMYC